MAIGSRIRAEALLVIVDLVGLGQGASAISRALGRQGLSYRNKDFLADVRRISGLSKYEAATRSVAGDRPFPRRLMVETDFPRPRNYRFHYEVEYYNEVTGKTSFGHRSMYGNRFDDPATIEDEYITYDAEKGYDPDVSIVDAVLVNVEHFEGRPY